MDLKNRNPVNPKRPKRVAIVLANPAMNTIAGWPCGFWWSELAHPYSVLSQKGCEIEVFSPDGGKCEPDAMSDPRDANSFLSDDLITVGFINMPSLMALIEKTRKVTEIDVDRFDAIVVAGGQAPMFTFDKAVDLHRKFVEFYEAGKIAAAAFSAVRTNRRRIHGAPSLSCEVKLRHLLTPMLCSRPELIWSRNWRPRRTIPSERWRKNEFVLRLTAPAECRSKPERLAVEH